MAFVLRLLALCGGALALAACATTDPYAAGFDSCDREAGACYADCRALEGEARREACQQRCSASVNRCFAQVRDAVERQSSYRVAADTVFYGRFGAYDPFLGYRYGRHGRPYSYGGYRYDRWGYDRWGYDRFGFDRYGYDHFGRRRRTGPIAGPGTVRPRRPGVTADGTGRGGTDPARAPEAPDDGRYVTEDGSVFTEDGRRLRYGGEPGVRSQPRSNGVRPTGRTSDPTVKPSRPSEPTARPVRPRTKPKAAPERPQTRPRAAPRSRPRTAPRARPRASKPGRIEP